MNDYKIIREVGKGGMGCVYEALDSNNCKVALKMMSAQAASHPDYREMFDLEVESLKKLNHSSIVKIVGEPFSDAEGNLYLPMEYVEGKTISQTVQAEGAFNEEKALSLFSKILDAFSYIHGKSCIHRDVKPSNIMIRPDGSVCVIDFGIAKDAKTSTGKTVGRIIGTDGYMSPEQANGYNIDTRTDIYSLGCLLHYMLSGSHAIPKQSNDYDTICAILENNFPLLKDNGINVSNKMQNAILKAVDKNMTRRFQTVLEFKAALGNENICKISVGRKNCDIVIPSEYISSHHLDIIWEPQGGNTSSFKVTLIDSSTNGTGVDGRKIKNESYSFMVNRSIESLLKDNSSLPQVMIAGLADQMLDWNNVLRKVFDRMDFKTVINDVSSEESVIEPGPLPANADEKIGFGLGVLCFIVPIVGWVLGSVWKTHYPERAQTAVNLGWTGFFVNLLLYVIGQVI